MKPSPSNRRAYVDPHHYPTERRGSLHETSIPRSRSQASENREHHTYVQESDLSSSSLSSSLTSWSSEDVVIKKVKRTVTVYGDDDDFKDRFRHLRTRSGSRHRKDIADHNEIDSAYTTITKQKKKTWTTVTELENGDVEEVTTTKIVTETYEPLDELESSPNRTPRRSQSQSRSADHISRTRSDTGKLFSPAPERRHYSKAHFVPDTPESYGASDASNRRKSQYADIQSHHPRATTVTPPPPESIVVTPANISRRGSVNTSYVNEHESQWQSNKNTQGSTHTRNTYSSHPQQQSPSISSVSSIEAGHQQPASSKDRNAQFTGYGPNKSYGYASLYTNTLQDSRPVNQSQEASPSPATAPQTSQKSHLPVEPPKANPPQYKFIHPWSASSQPKDPSIQRSFRYDPHTSLERRKSPSPSRSRSTSPSHAHAGGTPQVMCERCCSRHHHLPLDNSTEDPNINSPLRRLWSEGSVRVADRSTSPRSVSPTPSSARRQPSYLTPTVSSLAKCIPEGLPLQVVLEPNPNPMPKDMIAADEPDYNMGNRGEGNTVKGTFSRRPSIQSQAFSIPSSRSNSRRNSVESAAVVASVAGYSNRSRSPSRSVADSSTSPSRLDFPERKPRRQMVFVKDNVV